MVSKYFKIHELVPINMYTNIHKDLLWSIIDEGLIQSIDKLKEVFNEGSMTINNYYWGGDRGWSGIRTKDSKYYSEGSQHSIGKAVDAIFSAYTTEEVRKYIMEHQEEFPYIKRIEGGVSWLHCDTKRTNKKNIQVFYV